MAAPATSADLLMLDDVGLGQVKKREDEPTAAHTLYNLVDRRHGRASIAVSPPSPPPSSIGSPCNAIHIDINGPSHRQHVGEESTKKHAADRGAKRKGNAGTEPRM